MYPNDRYKTLIEFLFNRAEYPVLLDQNSFRKQNPNGYNPTAILFVLLCFSFSLPLASQNDYKERLNYDESTPMLGITAIEYRVILAQLLWENLLSIRM